MEGGSGQDSRGTGRHGRRSRRGCLTCRQNHNKCDETYPRCARCRRSDLSCLWPDRPARQPDARPHSGDNSSSSRGGIVIEVDRHGNQIVLEQEAYRQRSLEIALSTKQTETISHYISEFHKFSYQMYKIHSRTSESCNQVADHSRCAWTDLIELPRRSHIPNILLLEKRSSKKMTNWATYFLPHLTLGTIDDPLALAIAAFTALRMKHRVNASAIYAQNLSLLRSILNKKNARNMSNQACWQAISQDISELTCQDFLRIWATTLLLAEFESHLGNQKFQSQHVDGATTLSFIAAARFSSVVARGRSNMSYDPILFR